MDLVEVSSLAPSRLPLTLGALDHYTLIVADAAEVARFHTDVLGFELVRVQKVNAGSAPEGEFDMLNYVLQLRSAPGRVLVVTEGLNPGSIFHKYLKQYGPGVHHVAYEVPDIEAAHRTLLRAGYRLTSEAVLHDPLTGLRQVFIAREHGGYFIELLERTALARGGAFTQHNMAALARTMIGYLGAQPSADDATSIAIAAPRAAVLAFLAEPSNLGRWTGHRGVRRVEGQLVEVRRHGDVPLAVTTTDRRVEFSWSRGEQRLEVSFSVEGDDDAVVVSALLPALPPERLARTRRVIAAELRLLRGLLEGSEPAAADLALVDEFHLEVHQRTGL